MRKSYLELLVEEIILDFRSRKIRQRQATLFSVLREGLQLIAGNEGINLHHASAYSHLIEIAIAVFEVAKRDQTLSIEARADARQVLYALKGIRQPRQLAS